MENQEEKLIDLLSINTVKYLEKIEEVNNLYNVSKLLNENIPEIKTNKNTIILFDTDIFNSCYLIDVYNKFIENTKNNFQIKTDVFYSDNKDIYNLLFTKYFGIEKMGEFNKNNYTRPIILILSPENNDIDIIHENFGPLTEQNFQAINKIFNYE